MASGAFLAPATRIAKDHSRIVGRRNAAATSRWDGEVTGKLIFCSGLAADLSDEFAAAGPSPDKSRYAREPHFVFFFPRVSAQLQENDSTIDRSLTCAVSANVGNSDT
jgi:hypothetical protein